MSGYASTPTLQNIGERLDLRIRQGATFGPFRVEMKNPDNSPVDLTGKTIRGQIRRSGLSGVLIVAFTVTMLNAVGGIFEFGLTDEQTATLFQPGENFLDSDSAYTWDMEIESANGQVTALYYGTVRSLREVTR